MLKFRFLSGILGSSKSSFEAIILEVWEITVFAHFQECFTFSVQGTPNACTTRSLFSEMVPTITLLLQLRSILLASLTSIYAFTLTTDAIINVSVSRITQAVEAARSIYTTSIDMTVSAPVEHPSICITKHHILLHHQWDLFCCY